MMGMRLSSTHARTVAHGALLFGEEAVDVVEIDALKLRCHGVLWVLVRRTYGKGMPPGSRPRPREGVRVRRLEPRPLRLPPEERHLHRRGLDRHEVEAGGTSAAAAGAQRPRR